MGFPCTSTLPSSTTRRRREATAGRLGRRLAHHHVTHGTCRVGHRMTHTCFFIVAATMYPGAPPSFTFARKAAAFRQKQICASIGEAKHRLGSAIPGTLPRHITPGEIHRGIDTTIHRSLIRTQPVGTCLLMRIMTTPPLEGRAGITGTTPHQTPIFYHESHEGL